jgi:signal transduction histidine kinase
MNATSLPFTGNGGSEQQPGLAQQARRRIFAVSLAVLSAGIIGLALFITTQGTSYWDITFAKAGPQPVCTASGHCTGLYAWSVAGERLGGQGYSNISLGDQICGIVDANGNFTPVTPGTSSDAINHAASLVPLQGGTCDSTNAIPISTSTLAATVADFIIALVCGIFAVILCLHATQRNLAAHTNAFLVSLVAAFSLQAANVNLPASIYIAEISIASYIAPALLSTLIWRLLLPPTNRTLRTASFIVLLIAAGILAALLRLFAVLDSVDGFTAITNVGTAFLTLNLVISLGIVIWANVRPRDAYRRDTARIIGAGTVIAVVPFFVLAVLPSFTHQPAIDGSASAITIVAFPLALAFAVLKRDLLQADSFVRISTEQGLWVLILAASGVLALTGAVVFFMLPLGDAAAAFAVLMVIGLLSPAIRSGARSITEIGFFPEVRRYRRLLQTTSQRPRVGDERAIADEIASEVRLALPVRQIALLVRDDDARQFEAITEPPMTAIPYSHPLVEEMRSRPGVRLARDVPALRGAAMMQPRPGQSIGAQPWECAVPVMLGDRLLALLLLGPRDDGLGYSSADRDLLAGVASRRAIALDYGRVLGELSQALEEQRRIDALKDQFIMTAHHELRTPLTSLLGYVDIVEKIGPNRWQDERDEVLVCLREAMRSGDELVKLIDSLLAADRASAARESLHPTELDVGAALSRVVSDLRTAAGEQGQRIEVQCEPGLRGWVDPQAFIQIVTNLVTNALKYSPATAPVLIEARSLPDRSMFELTVRDWGDGIEPAQQATIFEKFIRLERDLNSPVRGTGLGLAIVRDRVTASGGRVWVESTGLPGEGSVFHVTFPTTYEGAIIAIQLADTLPRRAVPSRRS